MYRFSENVILIRAFYRREMSTEIFIYNTTLFQLVKYWNILLHSQDQVTVVTPPYKIDLARQAVLSRAQQPEFYSSPVT